MKDHSALCQNIQATCVAMEQCYQEQDLEGLIRHEARQRELIRSLDFSGNNEQLRIEMAEVLERNELLKEKLNAWMSQIRTFVRADKADT